MSNSPPLEPRQPADDRLAALRSDTREGFDAVERGEYVDLDESNIEEFLAGVKARGRQRLRTVSVTPDAGTDFWQRTHYGFRADNGWFEGQPAPGNFVMQVCVEMEPRHQYDQAGLMVRISPDCWLKTSVEFEPEGPNRLGAVVTNGGYSDWSTQDVASHLLKCWLRVERDAADYTVFASFDGAQWSQIRVAHLAEAGAVQCGIYACSPKGAGLVARFSDFSLTPR